MKNGSEWVPVDAARLKAYRYLLRPVQQRKLGEKQVAFRTTRQSGKQERLLIVAIAETSDAAMRRLNCMAATEPYD